MLTPITSSFGSKQSLDKNSFACVNKQFNIDGKVLCVGAHFC